MHNLEKESGCEHTNEHLRRRALRGTEYSFGRSVGDMLSGAGGELEAQGEGRRRLASWTLNDYDELILRCFRMLCFSATAVQVCSVLVAYSMPTNQNMKKVHLSRIGSVVIAIMATIIPSHIKTVKTACLEAWEERSGGSYYSSSYAADSTSYSSYASSSSYSSYSSSYAAYSSSFDPKSYDDDNKLKKDLTVVEGLLITAIIVMVSFAVSLVSMDLEREETYHELELAAKGNRKPNLGYLYKSEEEHAKDVVNRLKFLRGANGKLGGGGGVGGAKVIPFGGGGGAKSLLGAATAGQKNMGTISVKPAQEKDAEKFAGKATAAEKEGTEIENL